MRGRSGKGLGAPRRVLSQAPKVFCFWCAEEKMKISSENFDSKKLQSELSDKLCARVVIRHQAKGKGQLIVHYSDVDELDGILEKIH